MSGIELSMHGPCGWTSPFGPSTKSRSASVGEQLCSGPVVSEWLTVKLSKPRSVFERDPKEGSQDSSYSVYLLSRYSTDFFVDGSTLPRVCSVYPTPSELGSESPTHEWTGIRSLRILGPTGESLR